ncbi:hypothetical protein ACOSQ3_013396 [Xanthoceras sorbifolium]
MRNRGARHMEARNDPVPNSEDSSGSDKLARQIVLKTQMNWGKEGDEGGREHFMNGTMVVENEVAANVLEVEVVHNNTTATMEGLEGLLSSIHSAHKIAKARGRNESLSPGKKSLICKVNL